MNKTIVKVFAVLFLLSVLCSCDADPYRGKRPFDYKQSVWQFSDDNMQIIYQSDENSGTVIMNEKKYMLSFLWGYFNSSVNVSIIRENSDPVPFFSGDCSFSKKTFEIRVTYKADDAENIPDTLLFTRIDT